jgi:hypothetical protein
MRVSTPEATAVDLVRFAKSAGRLDNVATVLADLVPLLEPDRLLKAVRAIGDVLNAQRLGYLIERVGKRSLAKPLHDWLGRRPTNVVSLRPGKSANGEAEERRWHVIVTDPIEVET